MRRFALVLAVAVAAAGLPALADEIIYFTNGTSMPVTSHEVDGDMIRVILGGASSMAFPLEQVDRVEDAQGAVISRDGNFNRGVAGVPEPGGGVQSGTVPSRFKRGQWDSKDVPNARNGVEVDSRGMAVTRPLAGSANPGQRKLAATGNRSIFNQAPATNRLDGAVGARRVGNKSVLSTGVFHPSPIGIQQRTGNPKN